MLCLFSIYILLSYPATIFAGKFIASGMNDNKKEDDYDQSN